MYNDMQLLKPVVDLNIKFKKLIKSYSKEKSIDNKTISKGIQINFSGRYFFSNKIIVYPSSSIITHAN